MRLRIPVTSQSRMPSVPSGISNNFATPMAGVGPRQVGNCAWATARTHRLDGGPFCGLRWIEMRRGLTWARLGFPTLVLTSTA